ncbi:Ger(x)C family spore germination protein [Sporolactobacillus pectinivorans]|uniref:Ger(x)C family spore germination protein n=1 Tax=Sporolactobacillus pectinivorans TaxID=1591408 RepID=UPI000C265CF0|nr:Ger(x)C family spore germination protein [Sporolactobacillus pectinivorans]
MFRKLVAAVLIMTCILLLTGCWDKKELNQLAIVMAMGFDKDAKTGQINLTLQVIRPSAINRQQSGSQEAPYDIVSASGNTMFEALKEANKKLDRKFFFSHLKIIIVGERAARSGLSDLLDFVTRTYEMRTNTWLLVTRDDVGHLLEIKHGIESIQATYMEELIRTQMPYMTVTSTDTTHFIKKITVNGIGPVTGVFSIQNERGISATDDQPELRQGIILSGTAVFKKDKLSGYLNTNETRGLNYLTDTSKSDYLHVPSVGDKQKKIEIEVKKVKSKIDPVKVNKKTVFNIEVYAVGNIVEDDNATDILDQKQLSFVNREIEGSIQNTIQSILDKTQKQLKTDVIGFGRAFEIKYPAEWKKIRKKWAVSFPDAAYRISVKTRINQTGMQLNNLDMRN